MLLNYKNTALISDNDILTDAGKLTSYLSQLKKVADDGDFNANESSINLPFSEDALRSSLDIQKMLGRELKVLIVIGIGGSSLGTKALYQACKKLEGVKLFFLESLEDPLPNLKPPFSEIAVNVVSKSRNTMETITNLHRLLSKYPEISDHVIYTSSISQEDSVLRIPEKVGGRFSVFSPVGLFPLLMAGLDVYSLLEGAMAARKDCLNEDLTMNPAVLSAVLSYQHCIHGKCIQVGFYFHPRLEYLGKWWQQLVSESLVTDNKGITPISSIGTNDLHSMLQLYLDGPDDKYTQFVYSPSSFPQQVPQVFEGVKESYKTKQRPFTEAVLEDLSEKSLGYYMQFKMMEIMFVAQLLGVNAFDQPAVELYKQYALEHSPKDSL
jgi:glucose-6-phosphate isomerase